MQILAAAEPQKYEIKNQDRETKLVVHNVTEADSGYYYCSAVYPISSTLGHVVLKVSATRFYVFNLNCVLKLKKQTKLKKAITFLTNVMSLWGLIK